MLYGYELVAFASRINDFCDPYGFFCSCLLGLRGAWEINRQSAGGDSSPAECAVVRHGPDGPLAQIPPDRVFIIFPFPESLEGHRP